MEYFIGVCCIMDDMKHHYVVHTPSEEDAELFWVPRKKRLETACKRGMQEFNRFPEIKVVYDSSTKAHALNCHVRKSMREEWASDKEVRFEDDEFFRAGFCGLYRVRVKKVEADMRPKNRPSQQQAEWDHQNPKLFPEMEGVNLTLGYQIDEMGQNIVRADLTCWMGEYAVWSIPVFNDRTEQGSLFLPGDFAPVQQQDFEVEARDDAPRHFVIRPKKASG